MTNIGGQELKKELHNHSNASAAADGVKKKKKKRPRNRIRQRNRNKNATPTNNSENGSDVVQGSAVKKVAVVAPLISPVSIVESSLSTAQPPLRQLSTVNMISTQKKSVATKVTTKKINDLNENQVINESAPTMKTPTTTTTATPKSTPTKTVPMINNVDHTNSTTVVGAHKTREQIMAEREAKKQAKQAKKSKSVVDDKVTNATNANNVIKTSNHIETNTTSPQPISIPKSTETPSPVKLKTEQPSVSTEPALAVVGAAVERTREQIKAEREAKKLAKHAVKAAKTGEAGVAGMTQQMKELKLTDNNVTTAQNQHQPTQQQEKPQENVATHEKKPTLTKAERRAIQEAQRAAKAQAQAHKSGVALTANAKVVSNTATHTPVKSLTKTAVVEPTTPASAATGVPVKTTKGNVCTVKLFNHLANANKDVSMFVNNPHLHPSMARLGEQYAKRTVVGSNARCIGFLNALKMVIQDFETPPKKEFARSLEVTIKSCVEHLQKCRPLAVSVVNAHKHIKHVLTQLPTDQPESELKESLFHFIDTYIENQIGKAAQAISSSMQEKISNGDVILTFGCSSLINYICEEAHRRHVHFRVVVVDSRPFCEGQELLRRLTAKEIPCTYVLINAVGFVMPEVTKVLLGAHALLSNGYVMARAGTAQVALVARSFNVPVLVCCETHKFSERFQTDAIVYNELGNPDDLVMSDKCSLTNWQTKSKMSPLNLIYDITPPELVTAVVTEVSILPCTSVPVILRIKPTEIGYYS